MTNQGDRTSSWFRNAMDAGLVIVLLKLLIGLAIVLSLTGALDPVLKSFQRVFSSGQLHKPLPQNARAVDANTTP